MAHLEAKNLVKRFGTFSAVDKISFSAETSEFVTLLGPSGCGKTTLLKIIGGFYHPDEGDISIAGQSMLGISPEHRDTAMCFQSYALFPHLSIFKNVAFGLEQHKVPKEAIVNRVSAVLGQVDLETQARKLPAQLSGGQQQRVALARAIVLRPGVILFDEPLSNLDAKLRESVRFEIRKLQEEMNFTAIYVTHDQSEALALSDRILVMDKGKVIQGGNPYDIYNHPKNRFVADFIGKANILEGKILSRNGQIYKVATELGTLTVLSEREPIATRLYLGWRPENIRPRISDETTENNKVDVIIEQLAFQGSRSLIKAKASTVEQKDSDALYIEVSQHLELKPKEHFSFEIIPENIFFLEERDEPAASGKKP